MTRVLLAGISHETHSFTGDRTLLSDFRIYEGAQLHDRRGDASVIDGFMTAAARHQWTIVPSCSYDAPPAGVVDHAVFEAFWQRLESDLSTALTHPTGLDGVLLALHGAMVTTNLDDPEGELLQRIRQVPGLATLPVFGVFDLHASLSLTMGGNADCLVAYRENPHVDAFERAVHVADLLARCIRSGVRPVTRVLNIPILWPPTGTGTTDTPMRELQAQARLIETTVPDVWAVSVVGGYAYSDVKDAGVSFAVVTSGNIVEADKALESLSSMAWELRAAGIPMEQDIDEVLRSCNEDCSGPVLLVEPADNIGGGSPGDCTDVLRALIRHDAKDAGVVIDDPDAVSYLKTLPVGGYTSIPIGGKRSKMDLGPVLLDVQLVSRTDGQFILEDQQSHAATEGMYIDMGPCAVVRHRGITILLTSKKTPPFDLGQWRSQGIAPEKLKFIGVKAAVGHRRAYDPIASNSYWVHTRGPCPNDLKLLPYKKIRRPIFPLDL